MRKQLIGAGIALTVIIILSMIAYVSMGSGGFKRMVTLTGVYAVCKPNGYDVVCFLDSSSKDGGLSCVPLSEAGGSCK